MRNTRPLAIEVSALPAPKLFFLEFVIIWTIICVVVMCVMLLGAWMFSGLFQ